MSMKCVVCEKMIDDKEVYYLSDGGFVMCEECGDTRVRESQYGLYDTETQSDPENYLDDDLSDVDFFTKYNTGCDDEKSNLNDD
jgi:hypothetical protein